MDFKEIVPGIFLFENLMKNTDSFIFDLEESVKTGAIEWSNASQSNGSYNSRSKVEKKSRNCKAISIPAYDLMPEGQKHGALYEIHKTLNNIINPFFGKYCNYFNAHHWKQNEGWQLLKYESNNFFVNHYDDSKLFKRTISMSFFLNDNYEGGEIEFQRFNLKIKPKANQAIFFPSNYVYNHQVHEIISGTRYSIVGWWE
jgi:hypothetical protein